MAGDLTMRDVGNQLHLEDLRGAQHRWATVPIGKRLRIIRAARHEIASSAEELAALVPLELPGSLHRSVADTLAAEVLPLAEACRFLEREAAFILAPRREGTHARPFWLGGVSVEIRREPLGVVLVIGPRNYPLFLSGVQVIQALAAGNAVLWKPAAGGASVANALRLILVSSGLDPALLQVLGSAPEVAANAIHAGVDKVFLTGSAQSGQMVLHELAKTLTPSVMELSGCDAVFVLEGADMARVAAALVFSQRLNGSATCMAPRRIFVTPSVANALCGQLASALDQLAPVPVPNKTRTLLRELLGEARLFGAKVLLDGTDVAAEDDGSLYATLVTGVAPEMGIAQTDIFAPVLSVIQVAGTEEALAAYARCPYSLTAAVFGPARSAEQLAAWIPAGTVIVNDLIIPMADPRASFGGRGRSGFGVTRGREGLLEMTVVKTLIKQSSRSRRAYEPTTPEHVDFFSGILRMVHGRGVMARLQGLRDTMRAARRLK